MTKTVALGAVIGAALGYLVALVAGGMGDPQLAAMILRGQWEYINTALIAGAVLGAAVAYLRQPGKD